MPHQEIEFLIDNFILVGFVISLMIYVTIYKAPYLLGIYCSSAKVLGAVFIGSLNLLHAIFILMLTGSVYSALVRKVQLLTLLSEKVNVALLFFLVMLLLNVVLISPDQEQAKIVLKYLFLFSILPFVLLQLAITKPLHLHAFLNAFILACVSFALISLATVGPTSLASYKVTERLSLIVDPITFAIPLAISVILALHLLLETTSIVWRAAYSSIIVVLVFTILIAGTRQALLPLLPVVGLLLFFHQQKKLLMVYSVFIPLSFLLAVMTIEFIGNERLLNRYDSTLTSLSTELESRMYYWSRGYDDFESSPIFGTGIGAFGDYHYDKGSGKVLKEHVHNFFLELLTEEGIIGLGFFLVWLHYVFRDWYQISKSPNEPLKRLSHSFLCVIVFGLIHNNFSGGLMGGASHIFWFASCLVIVKRWCQSCSY